MTGSRFCLLWQSKRRAGQQADNISSDYAKFISKHIFKQAAAKQTVS